MISDPVYKEYIKNEKRKTIEGVRNYLNMHNFVVLLSMLIFIFISYKIANFLDATTNQTIWVDRFWNVGYSGIIIFILGAMVKLFKK